MDRITAAEIELSLLRNVTQILERSSRRLLSAQLHEPSAELLDASVKVAKAHFQLAEIAAKTETPAPLKHAQRRVYHWGYSS